MATAQIIIVIEVKQKFITLYNYFKEQTYEDT